MKSVIIWAVNDFKCDGMPGKNSYFRSEGPAREYFKYDTWQWIKEVNAVEIDGEIYFQPKQVDFKDLQVK